MPDRIFSPLIRYAPYADDIAGAPRARVRDSLVLVPWIGDVIDGFGNYAMRGTATRDGVPASRVRVYLISLSEQRVQRITFSGDDGLYEFKPLRPDPKGYAVVGFDPLGTFDPEAKAGLQPTPDT